jgi:hypothetical protein
MISRGVRWSRPRGGRRARYVGTVRAWAGANRHAGVLGRVTARRSAEMSAFLIRGSRFVMTCGVPKVCMTCELR